MTQFQEQFTVVRLIVWGLAEADMIVRSTWQYEAGHLTVAGIGRGREALQAPPFNQVPLSKRPSPLRTPLCYDFINGESH